MPINRRAALAGLAAAAATPTFAHAAHEARRDQRLPEPPAALLDAQVSPYREGFAQVPGGKVWWRSNGVNSKKAPVLLLHGGPAAGCRYMAPYAALGTDRLVVTWDQLGGGRSDAPDNPALYTLDRYVQEVDAVRAAMGLERVAIVGHSWGGWLGQAYAGAHPDRVSALVLAGASINLADMQRAADRYIDELPPAQRRAIREKRTDSPDYEAGALAYYQAHLCRLKTWPAWFAAEGEKIGQNKVYILMNGPSELDFTGTLKDMDLTAYDDRITAPTLITSGEFDYGDLRCQQPMLKHIRGSHGHVYPGLSHMSHVEDPRQVVGYVRRWLDRQRA